MTRRAAETGLEQRGWHTLHEDPLALLLTAP
jgi:hypothetical protein